MLRRVLCQKTRPPLPATGLGEQARPRHRAVLHQRCLRRAARKAAGRAGAQPRRCLRRAASQLRRANVSFSRVGNKRQPHCRAYLEQAARTTKAHAGGYSGLWRQSHTPVETERAWLGCRTSGLAHAQASPLHDATSLQPRPAGENGEEGLNRHANKRTSSMATKIPSVGGLPCWGPSLGSAFVSASAASVQMQCRPKSSALEALHPAQDAPVSSSGVPARIHAAREPRQYASQAALSRNGGTDVCSTLASACACSTSRRNDCAPGQQHNVRRLRSKEQAG